MTGDTPKDPKKSDTLQIRIPHETKKEFLDACEEDRVSASEVLRRSILDYLSFRKRPSSPERKGLLLMIPHTIRKKRYLAAGVAGIATLSIFAAMPSAAADPDLSVAFKRLDANKDGALDKSEFIPSPFPDSAYYRDARMNDALGLPQDLVWISPGVRQSAVAPSVSGPEKTEVDAVAFQRFDANRDLNVSYEEFQTALTQAMLVAFKGIDRDGDSEISREEFRLQIVVDAESVYVHKGPLMNGPQRAPEVSFRLYDRNGDGAVTFEEYVPEP